MKVTAFKWIGFGFLAASLSFAMDAAPAPKAPAAAADKAHDGHDEQDEHGHEGHAKGYEPEKADHKEEAGHKDGKGHAEEGAHSEEGAHADEEPWADRVGEGKAVEAYDEAGRLKLGAKAIARMGVKATAPKFEGPGFRVPLSALQKTKGKAFIYVAQADRWYERRPATVLSRGRDTALLDARLAKNELVVTEGSASLRAAELDLLAGESAGHGH